MWTLHWTKIISIILNKMEQLNLMTNVMLRQSGCYNKFSLFSFFLRHWMCLKFGNFFVVVIFVIHLYSVTRECHLQSNILQVTRWLSRNCLMSFVIWITNKLRFYWLTSHVSFGLSVQIFLLPLLNWLASTLPGSEKEQEQWSRYNLIINSSQNDATN